MAANTQQITDADELPIDRIREAYVKQGFRFIEHPGSEELPSFFGGYRPDAVALKTGQNVAIQFMQSRKGQQGLSFEAISRLFVGQPDWRFVVSYGGADPQASSALPIASEAAIRKQLNDLRDLGQKGQRRAAFVMGWSLLEAALHRVDEDADHRPRKPGTVLESLARLGYLSPEREVQLRPLALLRNRIVHGDITSEPSVDELKAVFQAVDEALT
ncbi:MAG: hypothetical protein ACK4HG_15915 [Agrobacterium albertimagni]|uniref:REase AHJR-like domain-containing protein n=1 Tax=Agrobacterium albertimagni AOL15 TaxID=1156935 RepID=K2PZD3_9HYPH|nr:hypothetical protein [Agrobacterium albertimagni]EKF58165.1 hypothetical protein QWE_16223 [Agrobacterium albertimagni AOL15]